MATMIVILPRMTTTQRLQHDGLRESLTAGSPRFFLNMMKVGLQNSTMGQAQRIAIARSLLHDGNILLLDEISSSLDEETERELYRRLFIAFPEKTMLFITHRSAVGELCDHVVMLERGVNS